MMAVQSTLLHVAILELQSEMSILEKEGLPMPTTMTNVPVGDLWILIVLMP